MSTSRKSLCFRATTGLVLAVSSRLYRDPATMVGELVINGLDAATRRGVEPVIEVRFWQTGEHPLSPDAPALTILDNGPGFTDEVIADYVLVGESVHRADARFHGTHGLGKFAAFGLSTADRFEIITRPQGERQIARYGLLVTDVFSGNEVLAEKVRMELPGLPTKESFACILVHGFNGSISPDELRERLTQLLPIRPCRVSVQGVQVALRRLEAERETETPPLPAFDHASVRICFAVAEVTGQNDRARIIDAVSGRPVASFDSLPPAVRRNLETSLLHPKLQGEIWVPGSLEKQSETGRGGIATAYWRSDQGEALIAALNIYGAPLAAELVGNEAKPRGPIEGRLGEVARLFTQSFGDPDDSVDPEPGDNGASPTRKPGTKPSRPGGQGGGGTKNGSGKKNKRQGVRPNPPSFGGVLVRVEDTTYTIISFACVSEAPGHVRAGNVIVINTRHTQVERMQKMATGRVREELARYIIEAHVAAKDGANPDLFGRVYQILGRLRF
ncbi:MAG: hypothetical protein UX09_C0021G0012 [Candidatus Uhrbacteria bacterium GW2011_GWE2_45_35]|uniref:Uncharacterized protein n=2 Tax=Candidatus Uhriibacteriota TaxID=1752732 RepID=A0A0G1MHP2_9BACT|nr:MAG: hypothetical protein UW63_C0015G0012 [Candidatus Uhrbacteria bacterium GW2011_GWF2_44_350]KKU08033.1 MAG: hypothetical protein UX09_C0021G0012 [Candidatus Uhrbacteria bacterium GW2011_GWE2_45_35]